MAFNHDKFQREGYFVQQFTQLHALVKIRDTCEALCREEFSNNFTSLASYHQLDLSLDQHDKFQFKVFKKINELKLHQQFVEENIDFFISMFGPDIDLQSNTYLRIARPGNELDNIGMHRDTDYGNSAFEVSLSLPLIDQRSGCGLNIVPKSHLFTDHRVEQVNRDDVEKGADKNTMGFLYAPKKLIGLKGEQIKSIPLAFGNGLGFSLGLIHGQRKNTSDMTRWSIDFRLKNSFHPMTKNLKKGYYTNLQKSSISILAEAYYQKNPIDKSLLTQSLNQSEK